MLTEKCSEGLQRAEPRFHESELKGVECESVKCRVCGL